MDTAGPCGQPQQSEAIATRLPRMTTDTRTETALRIYADHPLEDGDAVLLLDGKVCMEVEGLADAWDDVLRTHTAGVLRETAKSVVLAIARRGADLGVEDYRIWRELHEALRGSAVDLHPLQALPAL